MKKYRLKEEVKKYFKERFWDREERFEWWQNNSGAGSSSIEEVEERIGLMINRPIDDSCWNLRKINGDDFTDQEKELCEKALNGELLDIDSLDDANFEYEYDFKEIKAVLRQYLKEKK